MASPEHSTSEEIATEEQPTMAETFVQLAIKVGGEHGFGEVLNVIAGMASHLPEDKRKALIQELRRSPDYAKDLGEGGYAEYIGAIADALHPREMRTFEGRARIAELFTTVMDGDSGDVDSFRKETAKYDTALTVEEVEERLAWAQEQKTEGGWTSEKPIVGLSQE